MDVDIEDGDGKDTQTIHDNRKLVASVSTKVLEQTVKVDSNRLLKRSVDNEAKALELLQEMRDFEKNAPPPPLTIDA